MLPFLVAHAGHADWRLALDRCVGKLCLDAGGEVPPEYSLGWCYLTDVFAASAEAIVAELKARLPGVAWVRLDPDVPWPARLEVRVPE